MWTIICSVKNLPINNDEYFLTVYRKRKSSQKWLSVINSTKQDVYLIKN